MAMATLYMSRFQEIKDFYARNVGVLGWTPYKRALGGLEIVGQALAMNMKLLVSHLRTL